MKIIAEEIKRLLKENENKEQTPLFLKKEYKAITISRKNFHNIKKASEKTALCFIDGGNAEIIGGNNFSLQTIRTAAVGYDDNKKLWSEKKEFQVLITFKQKKISAKILPKGLELEFNLEDESLKEGKSMVKISKIGGFVRRIKELELASEMVEKTDFIILDGSLEEKFTHERKYLKRLYETANERKVFVSALSKTNSIITNNGNPVSAVLSEMKEGKWYYHPLALIDSENLLADIYFAKLNEKSQYVFKVDIHNGPAEELFSQLQKNSRDPVFPGYPYGLIEADRIARISNKEKEYLQTRLMMELEKDWSKIKKLMNTTNAHEILDSIS